MTAFHICLSSTPDFIYWELYGKHSRKITWQHIALISSNFFKVMLQSVESGWKIAFYDFWYYFDINFTFKFLFYSYNMGSVVFASDSQEGAHHSLSTSCIHVNISKLFFANYRRLFEKIIYKELPKAFLIWLLINMHCGINIIVLWHCLNHI